MIRTAVTCAATAAVALGAPGVAVAGVATADGGGVRFTDPAGAVDGLYQWSFYQPLMVSGATLPPSRPSSSEEARKPT